MHLPTSDLREVAIDGGHYHVELGSKTPIPASALSGSAFLDVAIEGEEPFLPRIAMTSVPFSQVSGKSYGVLGGEVNADLRDMK